MKRLSRISRLRAAENPPDHGRITMEEKKSANSGPPEYKTSKLQTISEVLKCELAKPGRSSNSESSLEPTKHWTPLYYAVYYNRHAALLHFLKAGQSPDGVPAAEPLLCLAITAGLITSVISLCEAGANVNAAYTNSGETPLHLAIKAKRDDILEILLRHKPDLNARTIYSHETPLHYAAARPGSVRAVAALLKNGANYEVFNNKACTAAEVAIQMGDLDTAITIIYVAGRGSHKLAKERQLLLNRVLDSQSGSSLDNTLVARVLKLASPPDSTPLVEAIKADNAKVVTLLLEKGSNPNQATTSGVYPIFAAFDKGNAPVVQALVEHGADVTLRNPHGPNVLWAVLESPLARDQDAIIKVFELLLSRGADPRKTDQDGSTLLHHAIRTDINLITAVPLLLQHGVNINAQDRAGNTALHVAVASPPWIDVLLKNGASPESTNNKGLTPFYLAIRSATSDKEPDLQQLFRASNFRQVDSAGKGSLHWAAQNGLKRMARLLIEARVDTTATDSKKRTPLLLAVLNHQWATVRLLATQPGTNSWDDNGQTALHHLVTSIPKGPSTWKHIAAAAAPFCEKGVSRSMRDQSGSTPLIKAIKTLPEEGLPVIETLLFQRGSERANCVAHEDHQQHNALYYAATLRKVSFVELLLRYTSPFTLDEWRPKKGLLNPKDAVDKKIMKILAEYEFLRRVGRLHRQMGMPNDELLLPKVFPARDLKDMLSMGLEPDNLPRAKPGITLLWTLLDHSVLPPNEEYLLVALKSIFAAGADPNVISSRNPPRSLKMRNAPQEALTVHPLSYVIERFPQVSFDLIRLLLDSGAKTSTPSTLYGGRYPLHSAVRSSRLGLVNEMLHTEVDVDCTDIRNRTALFFAAENGFFEIADLLLRSKARVDIGDSEGNTPLHMAAAAGNSQIVARLLRAGAKASSENKKGFMPLQCLPENASDDEKNKISIMLKQAQDLERRRMQLAPFVSQIKKSEEVKTPRGQQTATKESIKSRRDPPKASPPPATTSTQQVAARKSSTASLAVTKSKLTTTPKQDGRAPQTTTRKFPTSPPTATKPKLTTSPKQDVPVATNFSKQMFSISYLPAEPPVTKITVTPSKTSTTPDKTSAAPTKAPRIDSGFDFFNTSQGNPFLNPNGQKASNEIKDRQSWMNILDNL